MGQNVIISARMLSCLLIRDLHVFPLRLYLKFKRKFKPTTIAYTRAIQLRRNLKHAASRQDVYGMRSPKTHY